MDQGVLVGQEWAQLKWYVIATQKFDFLVSIALMQNTYRIHTSQKKLFLAPFQTKAEYVRNWHGDKQRNTHCLRTGRINSGRILHEH